MRLSDSTSSGDPKFAEPITDERCPDCELNGWLNWEGRPLPSRRGSCRGCETCCGNGRVRLITRERLQSGREDWLLSKVGVQGYRFASRKETLDPYMLDMPLGGVRKPQEGTEPDSGRTTRPGG